MRLIDADAFRKEIEVDKYGNINTTITKLNIAMERSTVDAVPVVRCKECRYFHENVFGDEIGLGKPYDCLIVGHCCCEFWGRKDDGSMAQTSPEGFCSFGERRSE